MSNWSKLVMWSIKVAFHRHFKRWGNEKLKTQRGGFLCSSRQLLEMERTWHAAAEHSRYGYGKSSITNGWHLCTVDSHWWLQQLTWIVLVIGPYVGFSRHSLLWFANCHWLVECTLSIIHWLICVCSVTVICKSFKECHLLCNAENADGDFYAFEV